MRVFDFEGIVEGLNELIDTLEGKKLPKSTIVDSQEEEEEVMLMDEENTKEENKEEDESKGMVLINNLSQVVGLLLKDNYARGMFVPLPMADERNLLTRNHRSSYPDNTDSTTTKYGRKTSSLRYPPQLEYLIRKRFRACVYL
jgi:hypothetical protein